MFAFRTSLEEISLRVTKQTLVEFHYSQQERGGAEAFLHKVTLNVGGWDYETTVGFSYDIAKHGSGILGQKGFFDMFSIKFDLAKEDIELKERK